MRELLLVSAIRALTQDLRDELEMTSCLSHFGDECAYSEDESTKGDDPCSVCAKWDTIEQVGVLMRAGGWQ
jgi:hypothetical protein